MRKIALHAFALLAVMLSGCAAPADPDPDLPAFQEITYDVDVHHGGGKDSFLVHLGRPIAADTFYPDGGRRFAHIRPLSVDAVNVDAQGPTASWLRLFAACESGPGFCASGVALDPSSWVPFRVYHVPLDAARSSTLADGSAASLFWSERNDVGFWPLSPLFMGAIWSKSSDSMEGMYGREVGLAGTARDGSIEVVYSTEGALHDLSDGSSVAVSYAGSVVLDQARDPVRGRVVETERAPGHQSEVTYRFTRIEATDLENSKRYDGITHQFGREEKACGSTIDGALFPSSRLAYADAFAPVQREERFRDTANRGQALLAAVRLPEPAPEPTPLDAETPRWEFDVQLGTTFVTYFVEERRELPRLVSSDATYVLVGSEESTGSAVLAALVNERCAGLTDLADMIDTYVAAIGADGYRQVMFNRLPPSQAFRSVDGEIVPEAGAYSLIVQTYIEGDDGIQTGPRIFISILTREITMIFGR